jgi:SPP1 family predicted phage head-tail adaptor
MKAGPLRNRLILQSQNNTRGAAGGIVKGWSTEATVWGSISPLTGREYLAIQQTQNEASVRIVMRYYAGLDETWRVVNGGRAYAIVSVINENDRDRMLTLMCLQGAKEESILILFDVDNNPLQFVDETYWQSVD